MNKLLYLINRWDSNRYYHSRWKWTSEWWWWRCTPHSPKFHDWSLIIRFFSIISRTLVFSRGRSSYSAGMQSAYSTAPANLATSSQIIFQTWSCPVGWGCRIHRLHHGREVSPPFQRVSSIWCKQSGALGNAEYPLIVITPRSTLARSGGTW